MSIKPGNFVDFDEDDIYPAEEWYINGDDQFLVENKKGQAILVCTREYEGNGFYLKDSDCLIEEAVEDCCDEEDFDDIKTVAEFEDVDGVDWNLRDACSSFCLSVYEYNKNDDEDIISYDIALDTYGLKNVPKFESKHYNLYDYEEQIREEIESEFFKLIRNLEEIEDYDEATVTSVLDRYVEGVN